MIKKVIKNVFVRIDCKFNSSFYEMAVRLRDIYYNHNLLNAIRRKVGPALVCLKFKVNIKYNTPVKLHLGCGNQHFKGYINIDLRKTTATDLVCNISKLPYPDNSVELIETYHVIEHLPRNEFPKALKEWFRVMAPGGILIIECPDFDKAVKEYIEGNDNRIDNIFGLQRFKGDTHMYGYNFKRLKNLLENNGFENIQNSQPKDYHIKDEPCLRIECVKRFIL